MMVKSKLSYFISSVNSNTIFLTALLLITFMVHDIDLFSQGNSLNTGNDYDDYLVLREMVSTTLLASVEEELEYRINPNSQLFIQYFIGANSFTIKSDIDLLNRRIIAQLEMSTGQQSYDYKRTRIDSLYLMPSKNSKPIHKYLYYPAEDVYALVMDQGKFSLVECLFISVQKGKTNPLLDSGTQKDRVVVKKKPYLVDTGRWYKVPKQKKQLVDFIKSHFRRSVDKTQLTHRSPIESLKKYNHLP